MKIILGVIWIFAAVPQTAGAVTNPYYQQSDTSDVDVRLPAKEKLAEYTRDDAFDYARETPDSESILAQILGWIVSVLQDLFANETTGNIVTIVAYLLFLTILILLINQYMKGNLSSMITKDRAQNGLRMSMEKETLSDHELEGLIQNAVDQNNFREAVCLLYRKSLRHLSDEGYITWKKDKTNQDYVYELPSGSIQSLFRDVTYYYEYAEYGHFPVDRELFDVVHDHFKKLNKHISGIRE